MGIVIVNGAIGMHIMQIEWSNSYRNRNFGFFVLLFFCGR